MMRNIFRDCVIYVQRNVATFSSSNSNENELLNEYEKRKKNDNLIENKLSNRDRNLNKNKFSNKNENLNDKNLNDVKNEKANTASNIKDFFVKLRKQTWIFQNVVRKQ